jgi:tetrahydromethanopterin S-methyltransferase subunit E
MLEQLKQATQMTQGFFIAGFGFLGTFLVLVLFYVIIRVLQKLPLGD